MNYMAGEKKQWREFYSKSFGSRAATQGITLITCDYIESGKVFSSIHALVFEDKITIGERTFKLEGPEVEDGVFVFFTGRRKRGLLETYSAISEIAGKDVLNLGLAGKDKDVDCYKWFFNENTIYMYQFDGEMFIPRFELYFKGEVYEEGTAHINWRPFYWEKDMTAVFKYGEGDHVDYNDRVNFHTSSDGLSVKFPDKPVFRPLQFASDCYQSLYGKRPTRGSLSIKWSVLNHGIIDDIGELMTLQDTLGGEKLVDNIETDEHVLSISFHGNNGKKELLSFMPLTPEQIERLDQSSVEAVDSAKDAIPVKSPYINHQTAIRDFEPEPPGNVANVNVTAFTPVTIIPDWVPDVVDTPVPVVEKPTMVQVASQATKPESTNTGTKDVVDDSAKPVHATNNSVENHEKDTGKQIQPSKQKAFEGKKTVAPEIQTNHDLDEKKSNTGLIISIVLALLLVGAGVFWFLTRDSSASHINTSDAYEEVLETRGIDEKPAVLYDSREKVFDNYFLVSQKNKYGVVDSRDEIIIPIEYSSIEFTYFEGEPEDVLLYKNGKVGIASLDGKMLVSCDYDRITYDEDIYLAYKGEELTRISLSSGELVFLIEDDQDIETELSEAQPEAIDLGLSVKWANINVGASSPINKGHYYSWGETKPKKEYSEDNYLFNENPMTLPFERDVAHVLWGGSWRMPTFDEWCELQLDCDWTWTQGDTIGYTVTSKKNGNSIFIPAAGNSRDYWEPKAGYYLSSTRNEDSRMARGIEISYLGVYRSGFWRYEGYTIRPVTADE